MNSAKQTKTKPDNKPSWLQSIKSVAAACFGVQSQKNHQDDFSQQNAKRIFGVGIVFVLCLILILLKIVSLVLA